MHPPPHNKKKCQWYFPMSSNWDSNPGQQNSSQARWPLDKCQMIPAILFWSTWNSLYKMEQKWISKQEKVLLRCVYIRLNNHLRWKDITSFYMLKVFTIKIHWIIPGYHANESTASHCSFARHYLYLIDECSLHTLSAECFKKYVKGLEIISSDNWYTLLTWSMQPMQHL